MKTRTFVSPALGLVLAAAAALAQAPAGPAAGADHEAIVAAVLDYSDGGYSGDATRMERALHPDLNKLSFTRRSPATGLLARYSTVSDLVELTRTALFTVEPDKRRTEVAVLESTDDVACVRLRTVEWNDYLQLIKTGGRWKIVNVLWTSGLGTPPDGRIVAGFDAEKERPAARAAAADYLEGLLAGDAVRLEKALHPETNQLVFMTAPQTNAGFVIRSRYSEILEPARAKIALVPVGEGGAEARVLDLMDGMACVTARIGRGLVYLQLQLLDGRWKVINALVRPTKNVLSPPPQLKK